MRKLKIAIVANSCWNIYNFRKELIRHLNMAGHQLIVIAPVDEYIHYLNDNYFTRHIALNHLNPKKISWFKDVLLLRELYAIYKREKPDLIFHYTIKPNIIGSLAAGMLGIKSVSTLTGLGYAFSKWKYRIIFNTLYKWALRQNVKVVFQNAEDLKLFVANKWIDEQKARLIPGSGVDTNKFRLHQVQKDNANFVYLFVGRLLKSKGLSEFVHAAMETRSIVKQVEFWVIGELDSSNPDSIAEMDLLHWTNTRIIKYFGHQNDVRKYLSQADVIVLPSYREGLSRAILEALSMEKPVITTNVAGCMELVNQNWNGFLVPPKEIPLLAQAMVNMYNLSDDARLKMGKNSRQLALDKYDLTIVLHAYDDLIEELIFEEVLTHQKQRDSLS